MSSPPGKPRMLKGPVLVAEVGGSVLAEAPQGVQAAQRVVPVLASAPVEPLTLGRLQEVLLGHSLLPFPPSLHGEGFRGEC